MSRFISSAVVVIVAFVAFGQQQPAQLPKEKPNFIPHEVKVGFNMIRAGRSAFGSDLNTFEGQAMLAMHQYHLVLDVGTEKNIHSANLSTYENKGTYFRIGPDWNFVKDRASGNSLSLGLRYARAYFQDDIFFTTGGNDGDVGFGEQTFSYSNDNLNARWFEVTFSLRGKIISNLYMGFTMRWQAFRTLSGEETLKAFDIPGFGKTRRQNSTAFDYYLMWRIPFSKN